MKREIKFRVWNYKGQIMYYPQPFSAFLWEKEGQVQEIMQYATVDVNGTDIYENEILFNYDRKERCIVKFSPEKAMFIVQYIETKDCFPLWESISNLYCSVGNVFENPELIKPL